MHYKNGRPAQSGDPVICNDYNGYRAGVIHSLNPGCTSCNAQLAYAVPGATYQACVTIDECYHAEDAFKAADNIAGQYPVKIVSNGIPAATGVVTFNATTEVKPNAS